MEDGGWGRGAAAAWERALRALARRPLTEAELYRALERAGHAAEDVEAVAARLRGAGHLDDRRLAEQVLRSHARRGHASARAEQELARRGVTRAAIEAALEELELVDAPLPVLGERVRALLAAERAPLDSRALRRVYNRLLRAGFPEPEVRAALEPHFLQSAPEDDHDQDVL